MFSIVRPDINIDFVGRTRLWVTISAVCFLGALGWIFTPGLGLKYGLDFSGGHEILVAFQKRPTANDVRKELERLDVGDVSVQSYDVPNDPRTFYLARVQGTSALKKGDLPAMESAFVAKYGDKFKKPIRYNPDAGDVVEIELTDTSTRSGVDTSSAALGGVITGSTGHKVRSIRRVGRPEQNRFSIVLQGVDSKVMAGLKAKIDPAADAVRVEFVGPTVGKQLRDDAVLALFYALLMILIYIALRFDLFYSPGAVICLFHDSIVTVGVLGVLREEISLATIAGVLTLVGYSMNDTIVVFDRIRETIGHAHGESLKTLVNKAINETLGRTLMTSFTVLLSCVCLMMFGRGTVLYSLGLIMFVGVILGTYSSIYIASPIFIWLRERFGPKQVLAGPAAKRTGPAERPKRAASEAALKKG